MQRKSNIVNTSVPFVVYIILIIPFIYEASLPNLRRRILSDSNKRNQTWRLKYLEMEDGTNTISDFALLPLSLLSSAKYNNQCWTGVCSVVAGANEESINLNKSGLYLRPETVWAFQLVPGHKYKQRKTCNNSRGSLDLYLWTLTGDKLIPHRENYFLLVCGK